MSNGPYAGLRMAARAGKPDPESTTEDMPEDDEDCSQSGGEKKEPTMTDTNVDQAALAEAEAKGAKAANDRFAAVLASEHYAGNEDLAKNLLATDLSADQVISALATAKPAAGNALSEDAQREAAEEGGRKEMQAALSEGGNSNMEPSGGALDAGQKASKSWDKVYGNVFPKN